MLDCLTMSKCTLFDKAETTSAVLEEAKRQLQSSAAKYGSFNEEEAGHNGSN